MAVEAVGGATVRLRSPHDLSFVERWGRVERVYDEQDSGNVCFVMHSGRGRVFVKYAGAPTLRYEGSLDAAVANLRRAGRAYEELAHPSLIAMREAIDVGEGHALVFDWFDGVSLGAQFGERPSVDELSLERAVAAVQQLYDFAETVAARGWVAVDLYDGSLLLDCTTGRLGVCDIDFFRQAPAVNDMGRMWGSSRFMAPEESELGAPLDEVTNVYTLGALAHTLLGDDRSKARASWRGSEAQWETVARAMRSRREERWPSVAELAQAWRSAC